MRTASAEEADSRHPAISVVRLNASVSAADQSRVNVPLSWNGPLRSGSPGGDGQMIAWGIVVAGVRFVST